MMSHQHIRCRNCQAGIPVNKVPEKGTLVYCPRCGSNFAFGVNPAARIALIAVLASVGLLVVGGGVALLTVALLSRNSGEVAEQNTSDAGDAAPIANLPPAAPGKDRQPRPAPVATEPATDPPAATLRDDALQIEQLVRLIPSAEPGSAQQGAWLDELAQLDVPDRLKQDVVAAVQPLTEAEDRPTQLAAIRLLGTCGGEEQIPFLLGLAETKTVEVASVAAGSIIRIGGDQARATLLEILQGSRGYVGTGGIEEAGSDAEDMVLSLLDVHGDLDFNRRLLLSLGKIGTAKTLDVFDELERDDVVPRFVKPLIDMARVQIRVRTRHSTPAAPVAAPGDPPPSGEALRGDGVSIVVGTGAVGQRGGQAAGREEVGDVSLDRAATESVIRDPELPKYNYQFKPR